VREVEKWEAEEQKQKGGVRRILPGGWAKGVRAAAGEARFRSSGERGGGGGVKTDGSVGGSLGGWTMHDVSL